MRIALGIGGGIAAYKSAELARLLFRRGHEVQAILTRSAQEFVTPLTLATLTGRKVVTDLFSDANPEATLASAVEHVGVAQESDLLVVAPATANLLGRFAHGLADDFLSTLYLAFKGQVLLAPSMNTNMWEHPATQANLQFVQERGNMIVSPGSGFLACGTYGQGRMAEPEEIADAVEAAVAGSRSDLRGETVLITAGPTQEEIDPVRYLSNRSSGKTGYALAEAAIRRGAAVTLVSGPVFLQPPRSVDFVPVRSAQEMYGVVTERFEGASLAILCAAVADFRPSEVQPRKIKKSSASLSLDLEPTPDILAELGRRKRGQTLIGFAAETENVESEARRKLRSKNCDMVVGNLVGQDGRGFESDDNEVTIVTAFETIPVRQTAKRVIADRIFDEIVRLRSQTLIPHAS